MAAQDTQGSEELRHVAETVKAACIKAAIAAYEQAAMSGVCHEGAWECAVDAMRSLDMLPLIETAKRRTG